MAVRARGGAGRLVLCAGEPGIGKTRLAQELAGLAPAEGAPVSWGWCAEAEGAPAFWPWRQVLRALGVDAAARCSAGAAESPEEPVPGSSRTWPRRSWVPRPTALVVVLDDVHWADEPSLLVLRHLADRLAGSGLVLRHFPGRRTGDRCAGRSPTCCGDRRSSDSTCAASA